MCQRKGKRKIYNHIFITTLALLLFWGESHSLPQCNPISLCSPTGLEHASILLPHPPGCWDFRCEPPQLTAMAIFLMSQKDGVVINCYFLWLQYWLPPQPPTCHVCYAFVLANEPKSNVCEVIFSTPCTLPPKSPWLKCAAFCFAISLSPCGPQTSQRNLGKRNTLVICSNKIHLSSKSEAKKDNYKVEKHFQDLSNYS